MGKNKTLMAGLTVVALFFIFAVHSMTNGRGFPQNDLHWDRLSANDVLLNNTFRIDIKTIAVVFDFYPQNFYVDCSATISFTMRPGQTRPVIHLDPALRGNIINTIHLNDEPLDFASESDIRLLSFENTAQNAIEFQRVLPENTEHELHISYTLILPGVYPRFSSEVNDIYGRGNEEVFPTINTPHELAHHILTFRVHDTREFRFLGSGLIQHQRDGTVQEWKLDTEREVASYTVMFALMPGADTYYQERNINGVDVRVMALVNGPSIEQAFAIIEQCLPEFEDSFGPYPIPRGLSVLLTSNGGGMEYYGATITSLWALKHEVFHMYFGCTTINKTFRDTWMDEAINKWYEYSEDPNYPPIATSFRSNIVSGRSEVAVGFDRRAYSDGAHIIEAVARELGGRAEMIDFLKYIQSNYAFQPYTTADFLNYLWEYSGLNMHDQFEQWVNSNDPSGESPVIIDQSI